MNTLKNPSYDSLMMNAIDSSETKLENINLSISLMLKNMKPIMCVDELVGLYYQIAAYMYT